MKRTKIVATLGPSCETKSKIRSLIQAGVNVFRFNLKHNTSDWHSEKIELAQETADEIGTPIAILLDLIGRDLRLGKISNGGVPLRRGQEVIFADVENCRDGEIPIRSFYAYKHLKEKMRFSADSGAFSFRVIKKTDRYFKTKVLRGGFLKENKGLNFPHLKVDLPALVDHDLEHLKLAAKHDVDWVALSFVCEKEDMVVLKKELAKMKVQAKVIAKIESTLGVKHFDGILLESDGIMIARGDLGIELPIEKVPVLQKQMIEKCRRISKPVITATQMMESMLNSAVPSRADVSDVANAVFDYTDAVMLSGETASGHYPVQTVKQMTKILKQAEKQFCLLDIPASSSDQTEAMVQAAAQLACYKPQGRVRPSAIVVITETGRTARLLACLRPPLPIIALTQSEKVRDQLCLTWGVEPYHLNLGHDRLKFAKVFNFLKENQVVRRGQLLILVAGEITGEPGRTNMVTLKEVWE